MNIIHKDCEPDLAKNKSLPINSYIIKYFHNDKDRYDIVQASCFVEVFDTYYDEYGKNSIKSIKWTDGRVSQKVYGYVAKQTKKKK